jgi:hypothetical protein
VPERAVHDRLAPEPLGVMPGLVPPWGAWGASLPRGQLALQADTSDRRDARDTTATRRLSWLNEASSLLGLGQHTVLSRLSQPLVLAAHAPLPERVAMC